MARGGLGQKSNAMLGAGAGLSLLIIGVLIAALVGALNHTTLVCY